MFLDIHLPKISGIDFLKTMSNPPYVILTTAFSDYALESYEFNVVDYLLKPFSFQRFVKAVAKVPTKSIVKQSDEALLDNHQYRKEIYIKSGYEHVKIIVKDIIYIKSDADYTEIITSEKKYLSSEPLRFWEENLNHKLFFRTHKSFIINTSKIKKIMGNQVNLVENIRTPIGRAYKETFMKSLLK
jgi:DNA-binding LytR/AlgR family response regulator